MQFLTLKLHDRMETSKKDLDDDEDIPVDHVMSRQELKQRVFFLLRNFFLDYSVGNLNFHVL